MQEEKMTFSLESVEFIFRHPWLFVCPIIVISTMAFMYQSNVNSFYQSKAILSLEVPGGSLIDSKFMQRRSELTGKVLIGENIRSIIREVWPEFKEDINPTEYNNLIERLRSPKTGISIQYDRSDQRFLNISFTDTNPEKCYNIVRATIDILQKVNREGSQAEVDAGITFLKNQITFYNNKIRDIDEERERIRAELKNKFPEMTDTEKDSIRDIMSELNIVPQPASVEVSPQQKAAKYDETLADLNLQLLEVQKKRNIFKKRIETGNFPKSAPLSSAKQNFEEDPFIKEYSKSIANTQLIISTRISEGYMPDHPEIKKLQKQISDFNELKKQRLDELEAQQSINNSENSDTEKKTQVENADAALQDMELQIETLKDKISLIEKYKKEATQPKEVEMKSNIVLLVSRLKELRSDRDIRMTYYADLRRQLELAELKSRIQQDKSGGVEIIVVEEPKVPTQPIPFQKLPKIMMGLMFGLGVGVALSYGASALDNSIKSAVELRELFGIPILASIDRISTIKEIKRKKTRRIIMLSSLLLFLLLSNFITKVFLHPK